MDDVRTEDSPNPPIDQDGVKDGIVQNFIRNRRIAHATTTTVVNNRYTTKYTLDTRPEKSDSVINSSQVHRQIFDAIKRNNDTTAIITFDNTRITHSKDIQI